MTKLTIFATMMTSSKWWVHELHLSVGRSCHYINWRRHKDLAVCGDPKMREFRPDCFLVFTSESHIKSDYIRGRLNLFSVVRNETGE